jgi:hypothetical protein
MRTAGVTTDAGAVRGTLAPPISPTLPQAWHSLHRPTHLTVVHPHSAHRKRGERRLVDLVAMAVTVEVGGDNAAETGPGR